jgi:hypothetical protein
METCFTRSASWQDLQMFEASNVKCVTHPFSIWLIHWYSLWKCKAYSHPGNRTAQSVDLHCAPNVQLNKSGPGTVSLRHGKKKQRYWKTRIRSRTQAVLLVHFLLYCGFLLILGFCHSEWTKKFSVVSRRVPAASETLHNSSSSSENSHINKSFDTPVVFPCLIPLFSVDRRPSGCFYIQRDYIALAVWNSSQVYKTIFPLMFQCTTLYTRSRSVWYKHSQSFQSYDVPLIFTRKHSSDSCRVFTVSAFQGRAQMFHTQHRWPHAVRSLPS